jgi:hypothetical protein
VAAVVFASQFATLPFYYQLSAEVYAGSDSATQWQAYLARGKAPDVLFVGDSQTRSHVDADQISALLSSRMGRQVDVAKIGVGGEGPAFFEAVVYRVMHRPTHPRLIVLPFNPVTLTVRHEEGWDSSADLFNISEPLDLEYMKLALRVDSKPGTLVRDWMVPYFRTAPVMSMALKCRLITWLQTHSHYVPGEFRVGTPCEEYSQTDQAFGKAAPWVLAQFREWVQDYEISDREVQFTREAVQLTRAGGAAVVLLTYPVQDVNQIPSQASSRFQALARSLPDSLGVQLFDLLNVLSHQSELWADPVHMKRVGALRFASTLAEILADNPSLGGR